MKTSHTLDLKCADCDIQFYSKEFYNRHQESIHSESQIVIKEEPIEIEQETNEELEAVLDIKHELME